MALSRFTPWFAVSALMPLGSSSTLSFNLDFKCTNVMLRLAYSFSFLRHLKFMHILSQQIMLVYLLLHLSRMVSEILENQTQLVYYLQTEDISNKGWDLRLCDIHCDLSLTSFWYFTFTHLNLYLVPLAYVDMQRKGIIKAFGFQLMAPESCINISIFIQ